MGVQFIINLFLIPITKHKRLIKAEILNLLMLHSRETRQVLMAVPSIATETQKQI